jgi:hypothetical protein
MFEKTSVSATQTFVYKNRLNTTEVEDINSGNLAFSFYAYNDDDSTFINDTVGSFHLFQITKDGFDFHEDTPLQEHNVTEVEIEHCHQGSKAFRTNWIDGFKYSY